LLSYGSNKTVYRKGVFNDNTNREIPQFLFGSLTVAVSYNLLKLKAESPTTAVRFCALIKNQ
jgi:hypothetical protein